VVVPVTYYEYQITSCLTFSSELMLILDSLPWSFGIYGKWAISNMLTLDYQPPPCCPCPCPMVLLLLPPPLLLLLMLLLPITEDGDSGDRAGIND
jgi:hypothetical protein